ncbi:hypothetical protein FB451DRAFT_1135441 [Mycena latifolia]|nr:hypothetical protein FB451DRAFT_1135441 [Mycena latifolia]
MIPWRQIRGSASESDIIELGTKRTSSVTAMSTSQDKSWKAREQAEEATYVHQKEQAQLAALRAEIDTKDKDSAAAASKAADARERDFEGGFGGQEDLEDRYATTSGEH